MLARIFLLFLLSPLALHAQALFTPNPNLSASNILPAEQAFILSVQNTEDNTITLHWDIAPSTYLYKKQMKFEAGNATLGKANYPKGETIEDPFFGETEVYYESLDVKLPVEQFNNSTLKLTVQFQGCNEIGFCYPPQTETLSINMPKVTAAPTTNETEKALTILQTTSRGWALAAFFGFGILLAFTPCVLPMVPILSALLMGEQAKHHRGHAFFIAFTYVIAMALTYAGLGAVVAMLGSHVQAQMQNPWVLSFTAGILLLMAFLLVNDKALSYLTHLNNPLHQLSHKIHTSRQTTRVVGALFMGIVSALVLSPCITPPLIGALTYITLTGDVALGASALFVLALGMGVPLLAVTWGGTAVLPKHGPWLETIKHIFAVLLGFMAVTLLGRFLPAHIEMALFGVIFVGIAFWIGLMRESKKTFDRLIRALAWVAFLYGSLLIIGGAMGNTNWQAPLARTGTVSSDYQKLPFQKVANLAEIEQAIKAASANGQPVMLDFYADWCTNCIAIERNIFTRPDVAEKLSKLVLLKLDVTDYNASAHEAMAHWQVYGIPMFIFFDDKGQEVKTLRMSSEATPEVFINHADSLLK